MYFEYQLTQEDYVAACSLAARKRSWVHTFRYIRLFLVAVIVLVGAVTSLTRGEGASAAFFPVLLLILFAGALFLGRNWFYARAFRKNSNLQLRRRADINDRTLHFTTESSDATTGWEIYSKFAENDKTFILFQKGNRIFIPIPKRDMGSMQVEELRMLMQQGLSRDRNVHIRA